MERPAAAAVVVGFDGSPTGHGALRFAADEAARRRRPLRIVCARGGRLDDREVDDLLRTVVHLVHPIIDAAHVTVSDPADAPVTALLAESVDAHLVVIGRGHSRALDGLVGSVARAVITDAACPVIVIGDTDEEHVPHTGPVLVGLDPLDPAEEALAEAFAEAELRGRDLVVVSAIPAGRPPEDSEAMPLGFLASLSEAEVEAKVRTVVGPWQRTHPGVEVTLLARPGSASDQLLEAGSAATMIVVGSHRRGTVASFLYGSVGRKLLRRAVCPLLVAHSRPSRGDAPVGATHGAAVSA